MPDSDKVIKGLETIRYNLLQMKHMLLADFCDDALDLLKEQKTTDTNDLRVFHCKKCGYGIEDIFISDEHNYSLVPKFCPNCGRKVGDENA